MSGMKKIYRSKTQKMLFGVCGGLGEAFGIDPNIFRILLVLIAMLTRLFGALILYLIAAIIIPEDKGYIDV